MKYDFIFDLETGKNVTDDNNALYFNYCIRYYNTENGPKVDISNNRLGSGVVLEAKHWNRLLRIIRDDELDKSGIEAIIKPLVPSCECHGLMIEKALLTAIKSREIKEFEQK